MVVSKAKAEEIIRQIEARRKKGTKPNERFEKPVEKVESKPVDDDVVKTPAKKVKKPSANTA
jgi:hypothetical protein